MKCGRRPASAETAHKDRRQWPAPLPPNPAVGHGLQRPGEPSALRALAAERAHNVADAATEDHATCRMLRYRESGGPSGKAPAPHPGSVIEREERAVIGRLVRLRTCEDSSRSTPEYPSAYARIEPTYRSHSRGTQSCRRVALAFDLTVFSRLSYEARPVVRRCNHGLRTSRTYRWA